MFAANHPADVEVAGDRAFVMTSGGDLVFLDIEEPLEAVARSTFVTEQSLADLEIVGDHAFLVGEAGLRIVDVSAPMLMATVFLEAVPNAFDVQVGNGIAYVAASTDSEITVFDASDPANAAVMGTARVTDSPGIHTRALDLFGDRLYVGSTAGLHVATGSAP